MGSLLIAGQGIGVLYSVLYAHIAKNAEKYLLIAFIVFHCYVFCVESYYYTDTVLPEFILNIQYLIYVEGPLFYLYMRALMTDDFRLRWRHALHLWPLPMLALVYHLDRDYLTDVDIPGFYQYYLYLIGYQVAALRLFSGATGSVRKLLSFWRHSQYGWFCKLTLIYLASSIMLLIEKMVRYCWLSCQDGSQIVYIPNTFFFLIGFYLIARGYQNSRSRTVATATAVCSGQACAVEQPAPRSKYQLSALSSDQSASLLRRLASYVRSHEPFLDENLTAAQLAVGVGVSSHQLSQLLNTELRQSFYDYINGCRAEKARQLLEQNHTAPMVDIGVMAGFANRTTFYKYFKKRYSKTPLQYRKSLTN